jgi:hypothetical protein
MSYAIPVLTLIVRGRGILKQFQDSQGNDTPWKFGKVRGLIINYIAVLYVFITSLVSLPNIQILQKLTVFQFFCFPPVLPVTASLMSIPLCPSSP